MEGYRSPYHGMEKTTRIIQGAPGAGKSSILNEMAQNSERLYKKSGTAPMVITLKSGDIQSSVDILNPVAEKMYPEKAHEFMVRIVKKLATRPAHNLNCCKVSMIIVDCLLFWFRLGSAIPNTLLARWT